MKSPYDKGPLRKGEIPRLVLGTGILVGGIYGITRYLTARTRAVATSVQNPTSRNPAGIVASTDPSGRGSRFR